jgi:hypothetical protein
MWANIDYFNAGGTCIDHWALNKELMLLKIYHIPCTSV